MSKSPVTLEIVALRKQISDLKEAAVAQRRSEAALRDTVEFTRRILDEVPCPLCRFTVGGQVLYANEAIAEFLGYESRHEFTLLLPTLGFFSDPAQLASVRSMVPEPPGYLDASGLFRRKNGSGCWAWFRLRTAAQGSDYTIAIMSEAMIVR